MRRDDHGLFAKETFSALLKSGDCADVTLVDEDNIQSTAHKVILSAGSDFFKKLFSSNPHPHPLVYLRIPNRHMLAVLNFIYEGNCIVAEADMKDFMEIATDLGILPDGKEEEVIVVKKRKEKIKTTVLKDKEQIGQAQDAVDQVTMSESTGDKMSANTVDQMSKNTADQISESTVGKISMNPDDQMSKNTLDKMSENTEDQMTENIDDQISDSAIDQISESIVDQMTMSESTEDQPIPQSKAKPSDDGQEINEDIDVAENLMVGDLFEIGQKDDRSAEKDTNSTVCNVCDKIFTRSCDLRRHLEFKHAGVDNDKCPDCGKVFSEPYELKRHINIIHSENTKVMCDICNKEFATKRYVDAHKSSTHSRKRNAREMCDICHKEFPSKRLNAHKNAHSREILHSCNQCSFTTYNKFSLEQHIRNKRFRNKRLRYKCQFGCPDFSAAQKSVYMNHIFAHHNNCTP